MNMKLLSSNQGTKLQEVKLLTSNHMIVDICINLFCPCILFLATIIIPKNMPMFFHVQQDSVSSMDLPQDFVKLIKHRCETYQRTNSSSHWHVINPWQNSVHWCQQPFRMSSVKWQIKVAKGFNSYQINQQVVECMFGAMSWHLSEHALGWLLVWASTTVPATPWPFERSI